MRSTGLEVRIGTDRWETKKSFEVVHTCNIYHFGLMKLLADYEIKSLLRITILEKLFFGGHNAIILFQGMEQITQHEFS